MISFALLPAFLIAGGSSFLGNLELPPEVQLMNHTLAGEKIPSAQVVCRNRWGTPMLPNGKAGYSIIAPIKKELVAQSLWIPPVSGSRPKPAIASLAPPVPVLAAPADALPAAPGSTVPPATAPTTAPGTTVPSATVPATAPASSLPPAPAPTAAPASTLPPATLTPAQ